MTDLDAFLFQETDLEQAQKKTGTFIPDFAVLDQAQPQLTNDLFFQNKDIYMSKHQRFAPYPKHSHQFLEVNYIYKGSCQQIINQKTYQLSEGDILIMDAGTSHAIQTLGKEDIVINILFKNSDISINWLNHMQGSQSILYHILLNSDRAGKKKEDFIIIRRKNTKKAQDILYQMMTEYFLPQDFSQSILSHYLSILLFELARSLPAIQNYKEEVENNPFVKTLDMIDKHYSRLTLAETAEKLNFNKNYLSNLIKEKSGQTFTQLLNHKKVTKAHMLVTSTSMSIEDISLAVGFSNKSYFYRQYKKYYQETPAETRRKRE